MKFSLDICKKIYSWLYNDVYDSLCYSWYIRIGHRFEKPKCDECGANTSRYYADAGDVYQMCKKCAKMDTALYLCNSEGNPINKCTVCKKTLALGTFVPANWRDLDQDDFYDSYEHGICHKCAKHKGMFEVDIEGNVNDTRICRCGHDIDTHQKGKGVCWYLENEHECECMRFVLETRVMCECDHAPRHHNVTSSSGFRYNTILECQHKDSNNELDCRCGYYRERE